MAIPLRDSPSAPRDIRSLRELIRTVERHTVRERLAFSLLPQGLPRGALIEFVGPGKTEALVQFLAENPALFVGWVEREITIFPQAIEQRKAGLARFLFVEAFDDCLWAIHQVLRSQLFSCVVVTLEKPFHEKELRRLQLEAEKGQVSLFLLSEQFHHAWPITMQVQVSRSNQKLRLDVVREKA